MTKQEYHRLALTSSVPYCNSVFERRMNTYLHLDTPPYHKRSNRPSHRNKRSSSKSGNIEATRPSLRPEKKTPASHIPEVFSYNMHNHSYYNTEVHVSQIETVSDPTLSGQSTSRSRPLPSQDLPSLTPGSDLSRRVTEGGRLKDNSKVSAGKDKQQNNNSSHQSLPEMHCVYRTDRTSQRPNSTCWPRLSDGRARVVWNEDKNPSYAMNGVLTVEALKQWVPDTKQRGSTRELMTNELGLQFLNSCQKTIAARHVKELDNQQHSMSSGSVKKKPGDIPLLSLRSLVTKKNQNNNSNGCFVKDYPHLPDTPSKTSLSPLKYVSGADLLVESLDNIASAGNSSERILHLSEDFKRKTCVGDEEHGVHRGLNNIASARNSTDKIPHQWKESLSKTDLREEEHRAKRSKPQRWGRRLLVAPKEQKFYSPWNDQEETQTVNYNVQMAKTQPQPPGGIPWPNTSAGRNMRTLSQHGDQPGMINGASMAPNLSGQRQRFPSRKGPGSQHTVNNLVIAEQDFQNLSLMDNESLRGRHGNMNSTAAAAMGQGDWRIMDGGYSRRILSANTGQKRETGTVQVRLNTRGGSNLNSTTPPPGLYAANNNFPNLLKVGPTGANTSSGAMINLSVVSGPAPVVQRPDLVSAGSTRGAISRDTISSAPDPHSHLRSTKSQRIRGASNTLRLKQLELRETHAVVLS